MPEKILEPIPEKIDDFAEMQDRIQENWKQKIYIPLLKELVTDDKRLSNAIDDLVNAINSGHIKFDRGLFTGSFNAAISRELKKLGAVWSKRDKGFRIRSSELPIDVKNAIALSDNHFNKVIERMDKKLSEMNPEYIAESVKLEDLFDFRIRDVDANIQKSLKGLVIEKHLTKEERAKIAEAYSENLKLYIKNWTEKEILTLRKQIVQSTLKGNRYENLIKQIEYRYGTSQNKARFLARQETSLLMTEFKKQRYQDAGVDDYIWTCVAGSKNHPVRPMHKRLDGSRQKWSKPPIVNKNGDRKNPGGDYNCRCYARPIVRF